MEPSQDKANLSPNCPFFSSHFKKPKEKQCQITKNTREEEDRILALSAWSISNGPHTCSIL